MLLQDYNGCPFDSSIGAEGRESDWLDFSSLTISSGRLAVYDPTIFDGPVVEVYPGDYRVLAKVFEWPNDRCVSRLRVTRNQSATIGAEIDSVGVDFAQVGVGDYEAVTRAAEQLDAAGSERVIASMSTLALCGTIPWDQHEGVYMHWVASGAGDGQYPVYELTDSSGRVGVEVVFIGPLDSVIQTDSIDRIAKLREAGFRIDWFVVVHGWRRSYIAREQLTAFAMDQIGYAPPEHAALVVELAFIDPADIWSIERLVAELAPANPSIETVSARMWRWVLLDELLSNLENQVMRAEAIGAAPLSLWDVDLSGHISAVIWEFWADHEHLAGPSATWDKLESPSPPDRNLIEHTKWLLAGRRDWLAHERASLINEAGFDTA